MVTVAFGDLRDYGEYANIAGAIRHHDKTQNRTQRWHLDT